MNEAVHIPSDHRPIVRSRPNVIAPWIFAGVTLLGAIFLYGSLESARADRLTQQEGAQANTLGPARALPELALPSRSLANDSFAPTYAVRPAVQLQSIPSRPIAQAPQVVYRTAPASRITVTPSPPAPAYISQPEPLVTTQQPLTTSGGNSSSTAARVSADRLTNPSFTVTQGTLIPAVLETALDSSRAGPARAMVSRDVRSFDRERILIPRGSKLIGEYQSDVGAGQRRAAVTWSRLIRPDGVTIDLRSPVSDGLGRAGIEGKVNNHTFRKIGDALLQTMIGVGSSLTQRAASQQVIIVPGGGSQPAAINLTGNSQLQPTLTVRQGARITIFVARDLDFAGVDQAQ